MRQIVLSQQAGAAPPALSPHPTMSNIETELRALQTLDLHELRTRWRKLFRTSAPPHLPRSLLLRIIAYRVQANAFGDLDRETMRVLDKITKQRAAGSKSPVPPVSEVRTLKPGTQLVREHEGTLHRITVLEGGYAWNETIYKSLSEVARAITGTRWNGPRFFGLRDRTPRLRTGGEA